MIGRLQRCVVVGCLALGALLVGRPSPANQNVSTVTAPVDPRTLVAKLPPELRPHGEALILEPLEAKRNLAARVVADGDPAATVADPLVQEAYVGTDDDHAQA